MAWCARVGARGGAAEEARDRCKRMETAGDPRAFADACRTPALHVARKHGLPFVYEVRDLWENASVDRGKFSAKSVPYHVARILESRVLRMADAVVTICNRLRNELETRTRPGKRVYVVDNGVNAADFMPAAIDQEARAKWNVAGKNIIG